MDISGFQVFAAAAMVTLVVALVALYQFHLASSADRRMRRMLMSVGLDPALAGRATVDVVVSEARRRCRHCSVESVCERWLDGVDSGSNSFCPNARLFEALKQAR